MRSLHALAGLALAVQLLPACGSDGGDDDGQSGGGEPAVTWHKDIAPLVTEHCVSCHKEGGIAPFSLEEWEPAAPYAGLMALNVETGQMPPWDAVSTDDCETRFGWRDDQRLSDDQIALVQEWADLGAPEGDPDTATLVPPPPGLDLTDATHTVAPEVGFATSGDGDEFICFVMDPGISQSGWITGVHMVPSVLEVAHHAVLFAVPPGPGQDEVLSQVGPDGYYDCFGGVSATDARFVGVWVPGSLPFETPDGVGMSISANSLLVMQMHYHPAGKTHEPDATRVQLRVSEERPDKELVFAAVGNAPSPPLLLPGPNDENGVEFRIPANVADHTETMRFPIPIPGVTERFPILSAFPHMHYVGVDLEVKIERQNPAPGEPAEECLLKVPHWKFDWQRTYQYDAEMSQLPTLGDGDELTIRCLYDNTLRNPYVQRALDEAKLDLPVEVRLGEETLDEMCLAAFGLVVDAPVPDAAAPLLGL